jgi:hypothetical protein
MTPKNLITAPGLLQEELDDLRTQVDLSYLDPDYSIITNYEVNWNQIGAQDRILNLDSEYERIDNQCFAALGVTRELLTGEGAYSGNKITVEILNTMFLLSRQTLKDYYEKKLFQPLAERRGWFEVGAFGVKKYWYPEVSFNRLTIRDNNEVFESLFQLYQKGSLNVDVIYELFNLNGDEIRDRLLQDVFTIKDSTFNRLLEEVHAEVGRGLSQSTDVLERITKGVGLKITNPPNQPQDGQGGAPAPDAGGGVPQDGSQEGANGFGGGFDMEEPSSDASMGESPEFTPEESQPSVDTGKSFPSKGDLAQAVTEVMPEGASEGDVSGVVKQLVTRRGRKVQPTLDNIAEEVAGVMPENSSDEDILNVVKKI